MVNYANGKIYRIICNVTGKQYIGSTTRPLSERLNGHKKDLNKFLKGNKKGNGCTSFEILNGGNYNIILIENVECKSKEELLSRERYYIESMTCVNKIIPLRTDIEYRNDNKDKIQLYHKTYYENNKEKYLNQQALYRLNNSDKIKQRIKNNKENISLRRKIYHENNRDKIINYLKENYQKNKEKRQNQRKEYYQKHKSDILQKLKCNKFECECGSKITMQCKNRHFKSKKHLAYLESLKETN